MLRKYQEMIEPFICWRATAFSDTLSHDHVWFARDDARVMDVAVFKLIRIGLDPMVDKLNVMDLVAEGDTGNTYII